MKNKVFIATSLDGYIADENGDIEWLHSIPNSDNDDMGYGEFMSGIDALIMGRKTFEIVCGFDIDWPYDKPVFVLSNTLKEVPEDLINKVEIVNGDLKSILEKIHSLGYKNLYIDGGTAIRSFLKEDLIDEMTITQIPILLGSGISLFDGLNVKLEFECFATRRFLDRIVQSKFRRIKTLE